VFVGNGRNGIHAGKKGEREVYMTRAYDDGKTKLMMSDAPSISQRGAAADARSEAEPALNKREPAQGSGPRPLCMLMGR